MVVLCQLLVGRTVIFAPKHIGVVVAEGDQNGAIGVVKIAACQLLETVQSLVGGVFDLADLVFEVSFYVVAQICVKAEGDKMRKSLEVVGVRFLVVYRKMGVGLYGKGEIRCAA